MGGATLSSNELLFTFGGSYVCANFGENRLRNATVRVLADRYTDRLTDANRFYNLSHAICYSCGASSASSGIFVLCNVYTNYTELNQT